MGTDTKGVRYWWKERKVLSDSIFWYRPSKQKFFFNVAACGNRKGSNILVGCIVDQKVRGLEMLDLPWFNIEEELQRLREIGILKWICHLRSIHPYWKDPEDITFTNTWEINMSGSLSILEEFHDHLLYWPDLIVEAAAIHPENLNDCYYFKF